MTDQIAPLNAAQWEHAKANAQTIIRRRLIKPNKSVYLAADSKYPLVVRIFSVLLLLIVTIAAGAVSAGKQIVAAAVMYAGLAAEHTDRLAPGYITLAIVSLLALAEFSVIAFGYGARVSVSRRQFTARVKEWRISVSAGSVLRALQLVGVVIALGGNLTAFELTYTASVWAFDLLITLTAPLTVIGVGVMIENMIVESLARRRGALERYNAELIAFNESYADPAKHREWYSVWGESILDALRANSANTTLIDQMIAEDPKARQLIVKAEYDRHEWRFNPSVSSEKKAGIPENSQEKKLPPKLGFAVEWLKTHPESAGLSGQELARTVMGIDGNPINSHYWNDAKQFAKNGHSEPSEVQS